MREDIFFLDPIDIISPSFTMKKKKVKKNISPPPTMAVASRTRSAASNRRVIPTNASCAAESKHVMNGDIYAGGFSSHAPHRSGKYLWSDGCIYEGEWRCGKPSGKGKFLWPSGAIYEGDFNSGRIEGYGTFVGPHGDTYRGCWVADQKYGHGQKHYANGDFYEGQWKRNLQDGHGRYVWRNGNEYIGEWKNGVISGRGVLVCANGSRFEGAFENGYPKKMNRAAPLSRESPVQKICIWESDGEAGDITCDIIDTFEPSIFRRGPWCCAEAKKPGQTISKGHKNYDLMLNLQLGIRYSVGKHDRFSRELKTSDFDPNEKFWTRFPSEGSKTTPPHQSPEFRWKDYCPAVFRHLRDLFRLDTADYMLAICGNNALRELSSPGKSGSFFYLTHDDRFMIKTVKKSEAKVLIRMLPSYYKHVSKYENSLLTKFFGVHCVKPIGGQKTRFIVMGNLFCSDSQIHRRFDLKGSSYGRTTDKLESEIDETTTLKDLDLNLSFYLQRNWFQELIKQINRDCEFLEAERIMDYSLLVGVHFLDDTKIGRNDSFEDDKLMQGCVFLESKLQNMDQALSCRKPLVRLGANMPARAEKTSRRSDFHLPTLTHLVPARSTETYKVVLYFGIIDILQDYDITKKLEHAYKSLQADPTSISSVDPKLYSKRFIDFIGRVFKEEE